MKVVLPEPFAAACRKDPACSSSSSLLINSQYYSPEGSMAAIIMAVIDKSSHMIKRDRNINTIVVSGGRCSCPVSDVSGDVQSSMSLLWRVHTYWLLVLCQHDPANSVYTAKAITNSRVL